MKRAIIAIVFILTVSGVVYGSTRLQSTQVVQNTATSTAPTRLQQAESLINSLQEQRQKDPSFIAETNKEMEDLKKARIAQSRIDALLIVQTQIDDELASIKESTNKK